MASSSSSSSSSTAWRPRRMAMCDSVLTTSELEQWFLAHNARGIYVRYMGESKNGDSHHYDLYGTDLESMHTTLAVCDLVHSVSFFHGNGEVERWNRPSIEAPPKDLPSLPKDPPSPLPVVVVKTTSPSLSPPSSPSFKTVHGPKTTSTGGNDDDCESDMIDSAVAPLAPHGTTPMDRMLVAECTLDHPRTQCLLLTRESPVPLECRLENGRSVYDTNKLGFAGVVNFYTLRDRVKDLVAFLEEQKAKHAAAWADLAYFYANSAGGKVAPPRPDLHGPLGKTATIARAFVLLDRPFDDPDEQFARANPGMSEQGPNGVMYHMDLVVSCAFAPINSAVSSKVELGEWLNKGALGECSVHLANGRYFVYSNFRPARDVFDALVNHGSVSKIRHYADYARSHVFSERTAISAQTLARTGDDPTIVASFDYATLNDHDPENEVQTWFRMAGFTDAVVSKVGHRFVLSSRYGASILHVIRNNQLITNVQSVHGAALEKEEEEESGGSRDSLVDVNNSVPMSWPIPTVDLPTVFTLRDGFRRLGVRNGGVLAEDVVSPTGDPRCACCDKDARFLFQPCGHAGFCEEHGSIAAESEELRYYCPNCLQIYSCMAPSRAALRDVMGLNNLGLDRIGDMACAACVRPAETVLQPCGHVGFCNEHGRTYFESEYGGLCPHCLSPIDRQKTEYIEPYDMDYAQHKEPHVTVVPSDESDEEEAMDMEDGDDTLFVLSNSYAEEYDMDEWIAANEALEKEELSTPKKKKEDKGKGKEKEKKQKKD